MFNTLSKISNTFERFMLRTMEDFNVRNPERKLNTNVHYLDIANVKTHGGAGREISLAIIERLFAFYLEDPDTTSKKIFNMYIS